MPMSRQVSVPRDVATWGVLTALLLQVQACTVTSVEGKGQIIVPAEVQHLFSMTRPGQVIVEIERTKTDVATLCGGAPFVIEHTHRGTECHPRERIASAFVVPLDAGAARPCDEPLPVETSYWDKVDDAGSTTSILATGSTTYQVKRVSSEFEICRSRFMFTITLQPVS